MKKPKCKLIGTDGNIFFLAAKVGRTLKKYGLKEECKCMYERVYKAKSYDEAVSIIIQYVEVE